jgi:hypothetical protein
MLKRRAAAIGFDASVKSNRLAPRPATAARESITTTVPPKQAPYGITSAIKRKMLAHE